VTGVDLAESAIELARANRAAGAERGPARGRGEALPFADASFDLVSRTASSNTADDRKLVARRVLKPAGWRSSRLQPPIGLNALSSIMKVAGTRTRRSQLANAGRVEALLQGFAKSTSPSASR
jgi:ubiquinone/menaquinone biosynthesis C-methylase UbiE